MGYVQHYQALDLMKKVDILLMPYQSKVSIGVARHDTAKWMSPMKMFEYLASGVPIISSNLPVLKEILVHNKNCILVPYNKVEHWVKAIDTLFSNTDLERSLTRSAFNLYKSKYTWNNRAKIILKEWKKIV